MNFPPLGNFPSDQAQKIRMAALKILEPKPVEEKADPKRWGYLEPCTGDRAITLDFDRGCDEYNIISDQATGLPVVVPGNNKLHHSVALEEAHTKRGTVATVKVYVPGASQPWGLLQDEDKLVMGGIQYEYHDTSRPKARKEGAFETYRVIETKEQRGSFGTVKVVMNRRTPKFFALKIIEVKALNGFTSKPTYEISALKALDHPNICKLEEFFLCSDNSLHLVLEHAALGTLWDGLESPEEFQFGGSLSPHKTAGAIMFQLCSALEYIHTQGLIHRDIKPDNILVASAPVPLVIKVADFGETIPSSMANNNQHLLPRGNFEYMAPEVAYGMQYNNRVDAYGVGVIFHKMVLLMSGIIPPVVEKQNVDGSTEEEARYLVQERGVDLWNSLKDVRHVDKQAQSLAEGLLEEYAFERLSMANTLKHPWLLRMGKGISFARTRSIPTEEYNHGTTGTGAVIAEVGNDNLTAVGRPSAPTITVKTTKRRRSELAMSAPPSRFSHRLQNIRDRDDHVLPRRSQRQISRPGKFASPY